MLRLKDHTTRHGILPQIAARKFTSLSIVTFAANLFPPVEQVSVQRQSVP